MNSKPKHLYRFWIVGRLSSCYRAARGLKDLEKISGHKRGDRLGEIRRVEDLGRCERET